MKRRIFLLTFVAILLVVSSACSSTATNLETADATSTPEPTATPAATVTPDATATSTPTPNDYELEEEEATEVEGGGDFGYDDSEDYSVYVDPALVGRWRSANGGALTITEDGLILDVDFDCWTGPARIQNGINDPFVQSIRISTDNGRANCTAVFSYDWKYKITLEEFGTLRSEILNMPLDSMAEYSRTEPGDGIEGSWSGGIDGSNIYEFYDDMTGWHNTNRTSYFISYWEAYTDETGTDMIYFLEEDPSYFDYSVNGDILTIYLSDGARTYQRVGY